MAIFLVSSGNALKCYNCKYFYKYIYQYKYFYISYVSLTSLYPTLSAIHIYIY